MIQNTLFMTQNTLFVNQQNSKQTFLQHFCKIKLITYMVGEHDPVAAQDRRMSSEKQSPGRKWAGTAPVE